MLLLPPAEEHIATEVAPDRAGRVGFMLLQAAWSARI
jgi:hypothetical protein